MRGRAERETSADAVEPVGGRRSQAEGADPTLFRAT
jgi:hypothetical protein